MPLPGTFSSQTESFYCHNIHTPIITAALTTIAELWHQPRAYQRMEREIKREIHTDLRTHTPSLIQEDKSRMFALTCGI